MVTVVERFRCDICGFKWDDRDSAVACEAQGEPIPRFSEGDRVWIRLIATVGEGTVSEVTTTHRARALPASLGQSPSTEERIGMRHVPRYDIQVGGGTALRNEGEVFASKKEAESKSVADHKAVC